MLITIGEATDNFAIAGLNVDFDDLTSLFTS